ncbi:hypothetical protein BWP39_18945 [Paraburkholderia acidicola]|uniref:DUF3761 domain-containing protein n=1 Tax=Paraburkholderia acidicola TaxID=1912599 RepID=A0A2A4EV78_9BURK|nr:DUF3761 domain-containing protein [Paraburkholderia acidicola]PCE24587.1 hypothetical protein BWP39_18945 [Paraburkholderia acidicola]
MKAIVLASVRSCTAFAAALLLSVPPAFAYVAPDAASGTNADESSLSNHNTYTNRDGNTVHAPARSLSGKVPQGASARCRDGTYSFSRHRSGTCSRHGGVADWL